MFMVRKLAGIGVAFLIVVAVTGKVESTEEEQLSTKLETQISITKDEFLVGEPISIKVVVTNHNSEPVHFWDMIERTFEFSAQDSSGKPVKTLKGPSLSGLFRTMLVRSGEDFNDVVFVNKYLDFPGPGFYTVTYKGSILFQKEPLGCLGNAIQKLPVSGIVTVRLRQGSGTELESALRQYFKLFKSGKYRFESQAAHALSVSEPKVAVKLLKEALAGEDGAYPPYTSYVTWALAKIGTDDATQALTDVAAYHDNMMARTDAIMELGRWHIKKAIPMLINLLSDPSSKIRVATLEALGNIGDKSCVREVEARFDDSDEKVRAAARDVYRKVTQEGRSTDRR